MAYYEDELFFPNSKAIAHSGFGIASFIISVIAFSVLLITVIAAGIADVTTPGGLNEESLAVGLLGLLMLAMMGTLLLSLVLGIVGWSQKNRKPIFSIFGTVLSAVGLFASTALIVLSFVLEG